MLIEFTFSIAASVLADGSISGCPCICADFHQGNIYRDRFIDVEENAFVPDRDREWACCGACAECGIFRYCEGNGMHLHGDNGDLLLCHHCRIMEGLATQSPEKVPTSTSR